LKILATCFFPAFTPATSGGESRLLNFYRALSRWHDITLLTSSHIGAVEERITHLSHFIERRIPKDNHYVQKKSELSAFAGKGDLSGPAIAASATLPTLLHKAFLEEYSKADILIFDDPFTAQCDLLHGIDSKLRIYNSYNCESVLYQQLHPDFYAKPIRDLVRAAEKRLLDYADLVLYCNKDDLESFRLLSPGARFESMYVPNGTTPNLMPDSGVSPRDSRRAVFVGSRHPPNVEAAQFVARVVAQACPDIVFEIIGDCLEEGKYPENVIRHGVIDAASKNIVLRNATIALNPITAGSGSNVKILEYFSFAIPVLSTSFGMRGIEAREGIEYIAASIENFCEALKSAMSSMTALAAVGEEGRRLALSEYTWDVILQPVADSAAQFARRKKILINQRRYVLALNDYDSFNGVSGGCTRTRGLYEAVASWSSIVFVSFASDETLRSRKEGENVFVITVPKTQAHRDKERVFSSRFQVAGDDIIASEYAQNNFWMTTIYNLLRPMARCIVVEHCYMVGLPLGHADRFVYSSHNNETQLKDSLFEGRPDRDKLVAMVSVLETLAVERSAATVAVSLENAQSFVANRRTAGPVIVVRNGFSTKPVPQIKPKSCQKISVKVNNHSVVFLGSAHIPNAKAAKFIVDFLAPELPHIVFNIIGSVCSSLQPVTANIILWGVLDEADKNFVMQSCSIALNPVCTGSGSNIKIADYLANGLFVVTTDFGMRGYPSLIKNHIACVTLADFGVTIRRLFENHKLFCEDAKLARRKLFEYELSMRSTSSRFVELLQSLEQPKKRILYVAYRYISPAMGGAEVNIENFVRALGNSGKFLVDVVAPEISSFKNRSRFSEQYDFDSGLGAPVDIPNTRFGRFPISEPSQHVLGACLRGIWAVQPSFEREVSVGLAEFYSGPGLTWGWSDPERNSGGSRWAFIDCGFHVPKAAYIEIGAFSPRSIVVTVYSGEAVVVGPIQVQDTFSLVVYAPPGTLRLETSGEPVEGDPRPLAFLVSSLRIDGVVFNLSSPSLIAETIETMPSNHKFRLLYNASRSTRTLRGTRLTDTRGPFSTSLERYIKEHVADYDLVIAHNNIFRTSVHAIQQAHEQQVPSVLIPHYHLDDDYYHFPDVLETTIDATLVLASPTSACNFLSELGCNVRYLSAGCEVDEDFSQDDVEEFKRLLPIDKPFLLVLGRKAGAKRYHSVIDSVQQTTE
jgi:glycosyltransferase involved in cell wall biosynthesis